MMDANLQRAKELGERIGRAIARDVIAEGMPPEWAGLGAQDQDQLDEFADYPEDSPEYQTIYEAARSAYQAALTASN